MKKRYIVSINGDITNLEDENFSKFLKEKKVGWWHWLSNTWLIVDTQNKINAKDLRDKAKEVYNNKYNLIIDVTSNTWFGFGPNGTDKNMFKWIKENWE